MAIWKNSKMFSICSDGSDIILDEPCQVIIDDKRIVISYFDEGQGIEYIGVNNNDGHFKVKCKQTGGYGNFHKFNSENNLEGFWIEDGYEGFWRIQLK